MSMKKIRELIKFILLYLDISLYIPDTGRYK